MEEEHSASPDILPRTGGQQSFLVRSKVNSLEKTVGV
jgi:hypothetical protein